ncbi:hypothetical protein ACROYT_G032544 [Oculina patagonica]
MANDSDNTSSAENNCSTAQYDLLLFDLACLGFALPIILVLASLKRRTRLKLKYCDGRPGLLIPFNFLVGISNRYTVAATFGATASKCAQLFLTVVNGDTLFDLGGAPWVNVFQGLVGVLVYGIVFYPFFACLTTEYKLIGSILGFLYGAPRFGFELSFLIRCSRALEGAGSSPFLSFIPALPTLACVIFIVSRFAVLVCLEVRRKCPKPSRGLEVYKGNQKMSSKPLAEESDIVHVKVLLGQGPKINHEVTRPWYTKLRHFIYKQRPDFKFSTQLISTMVVTSILIFQFLTMLLIDFESFKETFRAYGSTLGDLAAVLYSNLQGGFVISALISFAMLLHFVKCHRDHFFQLCRGQRGFARDVSNSPSNLVGYGLYYSGYQIAYAVWGFLLLGAFLGAVFYISTVFIKYKNELQDLFGIDLIQILGKYALTLLPVISLSLFVWIFQIFLALVVFRDRQFPNITVSIDNRRLYSIISYFFFFLNILIGLFSCLWRIVKGMVLGVIFVSRIDRTSLVQGWQGWDEGFVAYLGFLNVLVAYRHPVMLVFCELLNTRHSDPESERPLELCASNTFEGQDCSHEKEPSISTAYTREIRHPRMSQKAVNRWLLAVTLLRNPSLIQYRRQCYASPIAMNEADTESITVLVQ